VANQEEQSPQSRPAKMPAHLWLQRERERRERIATGAAQLQAAIPGACRPELVAA